MVRENKKRGFIIGFTFGRGAIEEVARVRRQAGVELEIHLITVEDLLYDLDGVFTKMGVSAGFRGMEMAPMPKIETGRRTAEELVAAERSAAGS